MTDNSLRIAMFQPDIAQNTGAVMRLCACLGIGLDIIEPCGFIFDENKIKKVAMDYISLTNYKRHFSWQHFLKEYPKKRIVLLSTKASQDYCSFQFQDNDILMLGRESCGVPDEIHSFCENRVKIIMNENARSLNVAMTAGIVACEAIRQLKL